MKSDLQTFDELFNDPLEKIIEIIDNYLSGLTIIKPDVVLRVEIEVRSERNIWMGFIEELKEWGKEDVLYGYIKIIPLFLNSATPMRVKLFCSHPNYMTYWAGLRDSLLLNLKPYDGVLPSTVDPWMLIPDNDSDRAILKLWHEGYTAEDIANRIKHKQPKTVTNIISKLRKKHKKEIVPYRQKWRESKKS